MLGRPAIFVLLAFAIRTCSLLTNWLISFHLLDFHRLYLPTGAPACHFMTAVICFPIFKDSPYSLAKKHLPGCNCNHTRRMSAPFWAGQSLNPYPIHYRSAFAFSSILRPHPHQCALRFTYRMNIRRRYGVSTFHIINPMSDLGAPCTPAVLQFRASTLETCNQTAYYSHRGIAFDLLSLSRSV